ncbi:MAG: glycosyltransferase [Caldilineaceae bacterium]
MKRELPVSVIIPTYQRHDQVAQVLRALCQQGLAPDQYEVIVVIDGSVDGTCELVAAFAAPFKLRSIWQPNRGRAAACNAGILAANGKLIILLDDDMEATPTLLAAHLAAHEGESTLGVVGAVPIRIDDNSSPVVTYIGNKFNQHLARLSKPGHQFVLRDFYSGNFSAHRATLLAAGLFDEAFTIYGNEDLELSLRLKQAGVTFVYNAVAMAYQSYTKGFAALAHDNIAKGKTAVLLAGKHPAAIADLKLSTYHTGSRPRRWLRALLLGLSRHWNGLPAWLIRSVGWMERLRPRKLDLCYTLVLDFCYWYGVQLAVHANQVRGQGLTALPTAVAEAQP